MRMEYNVATTTHLWDKAEFFKRIQEVVLKLRSIRGDVVEYLNDSIAMSDQYQINNSDTPYTSKNIKLSSWKGIWKGCGEKQNHMGDQSC
jgi:hypothetical protein